MKNSFLKLCSMFLVIVLLVNMLPLQVFAQQLHTSETAQLVTSTEQPKETVSSEDILGEIIEKRTEFSKEFLLESGLHMVTVYPEAVHYDTADGWEEIDNTLIAKADGTLTNTAGVWDVSFPQSLSKDKSITIQKDGYTLSFFMAGELTDSGNVAVKATREPAAETFAVAGMQQSTATVMEPDLSALRASVQYEEMVPEKLQSQLTYANVYQNTNVVYDLKSNRVKESVVLESYRSNLRGYRYTLDVGTMVPVLEDDGRIVFYDTKGENVVMVMPAPYLIDNAGEQNHDITVRLTGSGSTYTLTYLLPQQWLAAEDRAWPVILDPQVHPSITTSNIKDQSVAENWTPSDTWGYNACGYFNPEGKVRFFLMFKDLPQLTSSDMILGAKVSMFRHAGTETTIPVYVHKVFESWESRNAIEWDDMPDINEIIEDYAVVQDNNWYQWDVTDITRGWYEGENTGMMFRASDEVETGGVGNYAQFLSSDYGSDKPILTITFRNNNGIEDYWDYSTASAGRAGTGYVNTYTGNLTWIRNDIGFDGNRMPVTIQHIYNANDAVSFEDSNNSNDSAGNSFAMGNGWRTNYNQLVYQWESNGTHKDYYIWEDDDGTDHYFSLREAPADTGEPEDSEESEEIIEPEESEVVYEDEDGLELELRILKDENDQLIGYTITNKIGDTSYFDELGRLTKIENNQATKSSIDIAYDSNTGYIDYITDGIGRKYDFVYNDSDLLAKISFVGKGVEEISKVDFAYQGNDLVSVKNNDELSSTYSYSVHSDSLEKHLLETAKDVDGYTLVYGYTGTIAGLEWQPSRVECVDVSHGEERGAKLSFHYFHNMTTLYDRNGNTQILQFNNMGNVVCVQDDEGHAQYAVYDKNDQGEAGKVHQLNLSSKMQNTVGNMVKNGNFENGYYWDTTDDTVDAALGPTAVYEGYNAMQVETTESDTGVYGETYEIAPGETVTYSAHVQTWTASAKLGLKNNGVYLWSETLKEDSEWTRLEVRYTNTSDTYQEICPYIKTDKPGILWVDCLQLERSPTASRNNLIDNGDFRHGGFAWSSDANIVEDYGSVAAPQLENTVYQVTGSPTAQKRLSQTVRVTGEKGDSFVFAGWAKGNAAPLTKGTQREFAIRLDFHYTDDAPDDHVTVQFNPDSDEWQYVSAAAVAAGSYSYLTLTLIYDYNVNTVAFDGIQLFKEKFGTSYTYDEEGKVISVVDLHNQTTTYEYANNDLTKVIDNDTVMTYGYDNYHNVIHAEAEDGQSYSFEYDTYGNNTFVANSTDLYISTYATYSADGNRLETVTDTSGNVTTYHYNEDTNLLEWVQYPEDTAETCTYYTYDEMLRTVSIDCNVDTGRFFWVGYAYVDNDDLVDWIDTASTQYVFTRGNFGLTTSISAGGHTLATYDYTDDGNNLVSELDYGNPGKVLYTYDDKGRLTQKTYEDGETVTYRYDNNGELATVTDSVTGITTTYYYDLTERQVKYRETHAETDYDHSVTYLYNSDDQLDRAVERINGAEYVTEYSYDNHKRLESMTVGASEATDKTEVEYSYDGSYRLTSQTTKSGEYELLTESYTFKDYSEESDTTTTTQIATNRLQASTLDVTYSYTYDGNGNILSISDGTNTTSYVYDSANQLIRENNQAGGFTHAWEYDNAGNILYRKEYAYTTGSVENLTPTDTVTYTYGDSSWGDLLTAFDGQTITYDEIGNPLSDGTWTYAWQHGRQLASMSDGSTTWNYTYHSETGLRTQRTNGTTTYSYIYNGSTLTQMTVGDDTLYFAYDASGTPLSVTYWGMTYYYVTNIQGDVIALLNDAGNTAVSYTYDAWGNVLSVTGYEVEGIGTLNPLRYRGYVYDNETGLYYLQSRYYDPEIGRFLNADEVVSDIGGDVRGYNLFAYCFNNPVTLSDSSGNWPKWLSGALNVVSGTLQAAAGAVIGAAAGWTGVGAVVGAFLVVNGAATATQGIAQIYNSVSQTNTLCEDNIIRAGVESAGYSIGGDAGATVATMAYDTAVLSATLYAPSSPTAPSTPVSPRHTTGLQSPKKVSNPGGSHTQMGSNNSIYSYTQYDSLGRQSLRIDFQGKPHAGVLPHIHLFEYPAQGGRNEYVFDLLWNLISK